MIQWVWMERLCVFQLEKSVVLGTITSWTLRPNEEGERGSLSCKRGRKGKRVLWCGGLGE
jgi:hypothetical protein